VHTENEQSKPKRKTGAGPRVQPGQQVASNTAMHCNMRLFTDEQGEYYPVVDRIEKPTLVRGEYIPIGSNFHYPKQWGRKYAATHLIEYIMADRRRQIELAQIELAKLQRCLDKVGEWNPKDE